MYKCFCLFRSIAPAVKRLSAGFAYTLLYQVASIYFTDNYMITESFQVSVPSTTLHAHRVIPGECPSHYTTVSQKYSRWVSFHYTTWSVIPGECPSILPQSFLSPFPSVLWHKSLVNMKPCKRNKTLMIIIIKILDCVRCLMESVSFQNSSFLFKCLFVTLWGKFQLYKYVACWIITVSVRVDPQLKSSVRMIPSLLKWKGALQLLEVKGWSPA